MIFTPAFVHVLVCIWYKASQNPCQQLYPSTMSFLRKSSRKDESAPFAGNSTRPGKYGSHSGRQGAADLVNSIGYQGVNDVPGAPNDRRWYHGGISDNEAKQRLKSMAGVGERGSIYLVFDNPEYNKRLSLHQHNTKARYILMLLKRETIVRWYITRRTLDGLYVIGDDNADSRGHASVRKLIEYHRGWTGKPLPLKNGGRVVLGDYCYRAGEDNGIQWTDYLFCNCLSRS